MYGVCALSIMLIKQRVHSVYILSMYITHNALQVASWFINVCWVHLLHISPIKQNTISQYVFQRDFSL